MTPGVSHKPVYYNLYRFGVDEDAVGKLINGDLPSDAEKRWQILDAPRYHIQRLLDEHMRAQAALRDCGDTGRPFVLFLRSFSSEYHDRRIEGAIGYSFSLPSVAFQDKVKSCLEPGTPVVKLHGGSDGFYPGQNNDALILSTHSENWSTVAEELIRAASAIVLLVGRLTAGVIEEFDLIRKHDLESRCIVVLFDPDTAPGDPSGVRSRLPEFPHVFDDDPEMVAPEVGRILSSLIGNSRTAASFEAALNLDFAYLEPVFVRSEEFAITERTIWRALRLLRVMFEDSYWAALKAHGIAFENFTFPGPWTEAHKAYGLAVASADFRAVREALRYLSLLYIFRGADFALLLEPLAAQYQELSAKIFKAGEPDTESQYAVGPDPLKLPAKITIALRLFEIAEDSGSRQDYESAVYMYQAAVICALRAQDGEDRERRAIVAHMSRDWAMFQGRAGQQMEWAVANCSFAVKLFRGLAADDPDRYLPDLALCLNNFGALHFKRKDYSAADAAWIEALEIRRALPSGSESYLTNLFTSLGNLGLARKETGHQDSARRLYEEALGVCEKRMQTEPSAIVDLTRTQGWMALCLASMPEGGREALEYARRATANLEKASRFNPDSVGELRPLVEEARRVTGKLALARRRNSP
jgi:tetratricopeptide (TPR) repeat protein